MVVIILTTVVVGVFVYRRIKRRRAKKRVRIFSFRYNSMAYAASVCGELLGYQISFPGPCRQQYCPGRRDGH